MTELPALYGLVLAGGKSRRMGSDKALLVTDGRTQLARTVALLEQHVARVFVSARPDQVDEPERSRHELIVDRYRDLGPVAGILSAMHEHPAVDWLVVACDLPNIDDETIRTLIAARDVSRPFVAYASSRDGLPEPLCALYGRAARPLVEGYVAEGLHCPRKMLIRSDALLLAQPHGAALCNVNTPEDLADARSRVGQ